MCSAFMSVLHRKKIYNDAFASDTVDILWQLASSNTCILLRGTDIHVGHTQCDSLRMYLEFLLASSCTSTTISISKQYGRMVGYIWFHFKFIF